MFQRRTTLFTAIILLFCITAQPAASYANEVSATPIEQSKPVERSINELRQETKEKLADTQAWIKDKSPEMNIKQTVRDLELKVDRIQDSVTPMGRSLKTSLKNNVTGGGVLKSVDQKFTAFGVLLFLAFISVLILLSLSNPSSRLGGRH